MEPEQHVRVLIVDDTALYRRILTEVVRTISDARVVGTAANGRLALAKLKEAPADLVLLDVEMPVMDGLATLEAIRRDYPEVAVIMVSGVNQNAADVTLKALDRGALDFVPKPEQAGPEASCRELVAQLRPLVQLFTARRLAHAARIAPKPAVTPPESKRSQREPVVYAAPQLAPIEVVVIGVSTGGPNALGEVISKLPADLGVPALIVQHMPPLFTRSLADSLSKKAQLPVREATDGEPIGANTVLLAPGGRHMVVRRQIEATRGLPVHSIGLNDNPPENGCRPSVDVLFRSIAATYSGKALAVVMTGMGSDGCEGVRALKRRGGYCLTQSADTCVVYGMPMAVDQAGLSDESAPLDRLAKRIADLVRESVPTR
jgi:two-component system chemotaxis response regulator CheB